MISTLSIYFFAFFLSLAFAFFDWYAYYPIQPDSEQARIIMSFDIWKKEPDVLETFCEAKILSSGVLGYVFCVSLFANGSIVIIIYTTWKIHKFLIQSAVHLTAKTIDLQHQFTKMIISQSILPLIATVITMVINITGLTLQNYEGGLYLYLFCIYSIISACNPIITILCIKNYRTTVFFWKKSSSVVSYQTSGNPSKQKTKTISYLDPSFNSNRN